jgi:ferric-dicitrate binding protein FerR (iron transport regulator)
MNDLQLSQLLENYINDSCTPEEVSMVNHWYDQYKDSPDFVQNLSEENQKLLKHKIFLDIVAATREMDNLDLEQKPTPIIGRWWFKYAAAIIMILSVTWFVLDRRQSPNEKDQISGQQIHVVNNSESIIKKILPDESIIYLSPGASITYPLEFKKASRDVVMEGECFFEITKNPDQPFIISSDHIVTRVWGTSFSISDYKNGTDASVIVVSGKVSVTKRNEGANDAKSDEVFLLPEERGTFKKKKELLYKDNKVDMSSLAIWNHVDLSFNDKKLSEIAQVLSSEFNIPIKIQDESLNKVVMNADLTDLNLPDILEVLKASLNLEYHIDNDAIVLTKRINQINK